MSTTKKLSCLSVAIFSIICGFVMQTKKPVVYMIGDSTMANKEEKAKPETGWGQVFNRFFTDAIIIDNRAVNGRSSKSFIGEGRWSNILSTLKKGDYVIIQFGHNDAKKDTAKYTDPKTTFRATLAKYINETRAKGAYPILCTSIVRRHFDAKGQLKDTHGDYVKVPRQLAAEMHVPLIDMEAKTRKLVTGLGPEKSKKIFLFTQPGEYPNRPNGVQDSTHLNEKGAMMVAALAVEGIKELKLPLAKYLKKD
ncbi:MAG: rhamnogalacturonan acetylesterase [Bacteroidota bacterium]|nr:rhamnogalacturonan acetylesterase [Bacteroidota bacterium]